MTHFKKFLAWIYRRLRRTPDLMLARWIMLRTGVNRYSAMQMVFYRLGTSNHLEHNKNPDYWSILLGEVQKGSFDGGNALDFACGKGRNVTNLWTLADWGFVDGVDISAENIRHCQASFDSNKSRFWVTSGFDLGDAPADFYHFVVSTIALQHIPVYDIRKAILQSILRVLKAGGCFSFQMGFGEDLIDVHGRPRSGYFENVYSAAGTNADHDVRITNAKDVVTDLLAVGFENVSYQTRPSFSDAGHPQWIYIKCFKPHQFMSS